MNQRNDPEPSKNKREKKGKCTMVPKSEQQKQNKTSLSMKRQSWVALKTWENLLINSAKMKHAKGFFFQKKYSGMNETKHWANDHDETFDPILLRVQTLWWF